MPELPEVETVMRGLENVLLGKRITAIRTTRANLRIPFPKNLQDVQGRLITSFERRAKYILMHLENNLTMIVHLGMSGRMTIDPDGEDKHDHMILQSGNRVVVFNDPRRFGLIDLCASDAVNTHRFFEHLGPEPLERGFNAAYLADTLARKKIAIKVAIMDQCVVVGVGNIYAAEALFQSRINPTRAANSLKKAELETLVSEIKAVLKKAIKAGGSSLRDYVQADGELGYFQHEFAVYGRAGEACPRCPGKKAAILRITQGGRSTFYCPKCQK